MVIFTPRVVGLLAGLVNFGSLAFNGCFTARAEIAAPNPNVFSTFGQLMILVWGVAFALAGVSDDGNGTPSKVWLAFALEKTCYVAAWVIYTVEYSHDLAAMRHALGAGNLQGLLVPAFHMLYGPVDFTFLLLFAHLGMQSMRVAAAPARKRA